MVHGWMDIFGKPCHYLCVLLYPLLPFLRLSCRIKGRNFRCNILFLFGEWRFDRRRKTLHTFL
jgi:hypothetical protein